MPADHGLGLDDDEDVAPARPEITECRPEESIPRVQHWARAFAFEHGDLLPQGKDFKNPEAWSWNFTVERELFWKSLLSVGYVARRGLHLQRESDINQPTTAVVAARPGVNINALRPYLGFGSIRQTDNVASSRYHSLQVAWNRRFTDHLLFGVSYTLSKSEDDGSNQRDVVPDTYDTRMLWGPSEFDARHMLVFNYLYDLPFFRERTKLTGKLLGGWQISGVTQFQTGLPCSVAGAATSRFTR